MKRGLAASLAGILLLTGCSGSPLPDPFPELHPTEVSEEVTGSDAASVPAETAPAVIPAVTEEQPTDADSHTLFYETLRMLHDDSVLPGGKVLETVGSIEENRFAVFDLDEDGRDELILEITQADVLDCFTAVYDVDADGDLRREVRYETAMRFFSGGIAVAEYPDAAADGNDFVPYAVASYDPELDVFTEIAYVSAIDRSTLESAGLLDEYPENADTSGTGRVYCIRSDNPVDVTEYETWYASWHDGLSELEIPYQPLTSEQIEELS